MIKRLTAKRRTELLEVVRKIGSLTKKQIGWCLRNTAKYIWFDNHDAQNGHCERCGHNVHFEKKTRHGQKTLCPHCRQELKIRHSWRVSYTENINFRAIVKVIKSDEFMLRYVLINQIGKDRKVIEVAREVVNMTDKMRKEFEIIDGEWVFGNKNRWFTERFMWNWRKYCCLSANVYIPGLKAELKKLDRIRYLDNPVEYNSNSWYVTAFVRELYERADLYEKLEKVGLKEIAIKDFDNNCGWSYREKIDYDPRQTSLNKMLKVDKANMRRFIASKSTRRLHLMQKYPVITDDAMEIIEKFNVNDYEFDELNELKVGNINKMLSYLCTGSERMNIREYCQYVRTIQKLGYKMDDSYLYPKNFRKADDKATDDYNRQQDTIKIALSKAQSAVMKQISDGLKQMKDLAEFMDGSKGLLVYVPESAKDLIEEGRKQHNCCGSYVERVAEKKTMVFFVRKMDAPNEPFVAFEYANGEVIQCRYDYNKNVEDTKIINFVDAFSERLRQNKVMVA